MGWFNVPKGAYPGLHQIDLTRPVADGETGIERGSCIYEDVNNEFRLATVAQAGAADSPGAYIYFALQGQNDLDAAMAGNVGQGAVPVADAQARVTGLACGQPLDIETDQFTGVSFAVGSFLAVGAAGKLVAHADGNTAVGQVIRDIYSRYINDAAAVTGFRTGNVGNVIQFRSMYIPNLSTM